MGYRIHYGESIMKESIPDIGQKQKIRVGVIWISVICCVLMFMFLKHKETIVDHLLPGNSKHTKAAISAFADDLKDGQPIKEAAIAFCREIIENANVQD